MWDMKVDIEKRCMVKSNPHLKIYTIAAESKEIGGQKILNYLMSSDINKALYCEPVMGIVLVKDGGFEAAFNKYTAK